ncbi:ABC transporter ATP-binding protein [Pseudolysinimonas sp.]|uniref:ABC transporter ATP-binding protein n=1 Tax=Pseudolysinimonas sp. TaxID=2680009 RepID=UPI003F7DD672
MPTSAALPVRLRDVGKRFGPRRVLGGIDLDITAGEIVALLGPSGCGKSTLLRLLAGLDHPDDGVTLLDGTPVADVDQRCAVAFQEPRLLPWRTVERNVRLGLPRDASGEAGSERVRELLELVQLSDASGLRPRQISGGMAQRAALARALARTPGVLLLDEPFGALDALTRLTMQDLLLDVHRTEPATIVLVTHDVDEAIALADTVVVLGPRADAPDAGSGIRALHTVPGGRPRDRTDARLADLRAELLEQLGVPSHHSRSTPSTPKRQTA